MSGKRTVYLKYQRPAETKEKLENLKKEKEKLCYANHKTKTKLNKSKQNTKKNGKGKELIL